MSALDLSDQPILVNEPPTHDSPVEVIVLLIDSDPSSVEFMARAHAVRHACGGGRSNLGC
ncbi:MAG: hypothetical protein ACKO42_05830 [Gammaproteobacteria bacterium]